MRISIALLGLLAFASTAHAQSPSFGLKAGLNVSDVYFNDEFIADEGLNKQPRLGFVGGLTADIPFTPTFGVRAEALYAQKGFAIDFSDDDFDPIDGKQTLKLDYLEVPLLLRFSLPMDNGLEIGLLAGAVPAFKLNESIGCSGDFDDSACDEIDDEMGDEGFGLKSFDLGGALGGTVGAGPFGVDFRYTYGFTNISEEGADNFANDGDANNGVFSITAAYRFGR